MEKHKSILKMTDLQLGYKGRKTEFLVGPLINLDLLNGEFIGILGSNGIGKSTLLRTITGVQPPINGKIEILGRNLEELTNQERAQTISVVFTEPPATKTLDVFELIALGRQPYTNWLGNLSETDLEQVNYSIEKLGLEKLKHKKCFELSDGQLQKVLIARALAQNTDIIFLDEPTTHLDLYHRTQILKTLKLLVKDIGKTILFSSHEIDLCIQMCDKIILMLEQEVIYGTPDQLISLGKFNELFDSDLVEFNTETKSFKVKK